MPENYNNTTKGYDNRTDAEVAELSEQARRYLATLPYEQSKKYEAAGRPTAYASTTYIPPTIRIGGTPTDNHLTRLVQFQAHGEPIILVPYKPSVLPTAAHDSTTALYIEQMKIANLMHSVGSTHLGTTSPGNLWSLPPDEISGYPNRFETLERVQGLPMPEINTIEELLRHILFEASLVLAAINGKDIHEVSSALFNFTNKQEQTKRNLTSILNMVLQKITNTINNSRYDKEYDCNAIPTDSCTRLVVMGLKGQGKSTLLDTVMSVIAKNTGDNIFEPAFADPYAPTKEFLAMLRNSPPPPGLEAFLRKTRYGNRLDDDYSPPFIVPWMFDAMDVPVTTDDPRHLLTSRSDAPFRLCDPGGFRKGQRPTSMELTAALLADSVTYLHRQQDEGRLYHQPERLLFLRTTTGYESIEPLRNILWGSSRYHGTALPAYLEAIGNPARDRDIQTITAEIIMHMSSAMSLKFVRLNTTFNKLLKHLTSLHLNPRLKTVRDLHSGLPTQVNGHLDRLRYIRQDIANRYDRNATSIIIVPRQHNLAALDRLLDTVLSVETLE